MASSSSPNTAPSSPTIVYDTICDTCGKFFGRRRKVAWSMFSRKRTYYWPEHRLMRDRHQSKFHSAFGDMRASAHSGCHMCTLILSSLTGADIQVASDSEMTINTWLSDQFGDGPKGLGIHIDLVDAGSSNTEEPLTRFFYIAQLSVQEKNKIIARRLHNTVEISEESVQQIQQWLRKCRQDHQICGQSWTLTSKERSMPTRLIEITGPALNWRLRLVNGSEICVEKDYATLSHCWGDSMFIHLTLENYHVYKENVPFENLSVTFQHAVETTFRLGINPSTTIQHTVGLTFALGISYLWIDSLCIIQDSSDDWLRESAMMGSIYALGALNLAATYSQNVDGGLFNQSKELSSSPCIINMSDKNGTSKGAVLYQPDVWNREVEDTPLGKRAWVVQERILAPRTIHFSAKQLLWECCQESQAELAFDDDPIVLAPLKRVTPFIDLSHHDYVRVHESWADIVKKYSTCSLTVQSDKLVAISGLARRCRGQLGVSEDDYAAGIWKSNLIEGLLYFTRSFRGTIRFPSRAPSWSWASINAKIRFVYQHESSRELVDILDVQTYHNGDPSGQLRGGPRELVDILDVQTYHNGDPFGQLRGGFIRIQGPIAELPSQNTILKMGQRSADITHTNGILYTFSVAPEEAKFDTHANEAGHDPIYFLVLTADPETYGPREGGEALNVLVCGLLLHPTGIKRGQFERVGAVTGHSAKHFENSLRKAKDPKTLDEALYEEADPEKGFTIEII
ncbi:hypothetical protein VTL71DRAFT_1185 [Oculimacula yallundae]|uniref:Heterokaryon incompatibility domain-containing protein n=1 Tax=Oculimacula yallundae TaxID=86028 RepID=A0ABR4D246_9HELO